MICLNFCQSIINYFYLKDVVNCIDVPQLCSPQATCTLQDDNDKSIGRCVCNTGFDGDGNN